MDNGAGKEGTKHDNRIIEYSRIAFHDRLDHRIYPGSDLR